MKCPCLPPKKMVFPLNSHKKVLSFEKLFLVLCSTKQGNNHLILWGVGVDFLLWGKNMKIFKSTFVISENPHSSCIVCCVLVFSSLHLMHQNHGAYQINDITAFITSQPAFPFGIFDQGSSNALLWAIILSFSISWILWTPHSHNRFHFIRKPFIIIFGGGGETPKYFGALASILFIHMLIECKVFYTTQKNNLSFTKLLGGGGSEQTPTSYPPRYQLVAV